MDKRNIDAYAMLLSIYKHLIFKYHVPDHLHDSYYQIIVYCLPFYSYCPALSGKLKRSIAIRNKVCHFRHVNKHDLDLLESICDSFNIGAPLNTF